MDSQKVASILNKQLKEISDLKDLNPEDPKFKLWQENCLTIFKKIFPKEDDWHYRFGWSAFHVNRIKTTQEASLYTQEDIRAFEEGLKNAEVTIKAALNKLELFGASPEQDSRSDAKDNNGLTIKISNNLNNSQSVNLTVNFDQIIQVIDDLDADTEKKNQAKTEVAKLKDELQKNNPSWEKIKNILIWILNFSRDVFIKILPYILDKYSSN